MNAFLHIELSELADQQIKEADEWWRENRQKAPNAIREELERVTSMIAFQPNIGGVARNVHLRGVRRIHIERIHVDLYYRVTGSPAHIEILAFWGSRRGSPPPI